MFRTSFVFTALAMSLLTTAPFVIAGCSSEDSSSSSTTTSGSQVVGPSGGTISLEGATLTIPEGALDKEVTITYAVKDKASMPNASDIAAPVFEFGPNGTKFLKPVTLNIEFTGTPPEGKSAKLAWLDTTKNTWTELADSAVTGQSVTATTDHFTAFTVVFMGSGTQVGGGCSGMPFTACGGDLTGTWTLEAACAEFDPVNADPNCPSAKLAATVDIVGTMTFQGGTMTLDTTVTVSSTYTLPKSCLPPGATCDALKATDTGDSCTLSETQPPQQEKGSKPYSTSGSKLSVTKSDQTVDELDYCVQGNTLTIQDIGDKGEKMIIRAKKN